MWRRRARAIDTGIDVDAECERLRARLREVRIAWTLDGAAPRAALVAATNAVLDASPLPLARLSPLAREHVLACDSAAGAGLVLVGRRVQTAVGLRFH